MKTLVESGRALRPLHDLVTQQLHLRSLRTVKEDTFESFLSSLIEMKLDQASKFAWQQRMHERRDVPSIDELLQFVDWRAQASKLSTSQDAERKLPTMEKKTKTLTSYRVTMERRCAACNNDSHPMYACTSFQTLPHEERVAIVKRQSLCMNCPHDRHFASQCQSSQKC